MHRILFQIGPVTIYSYGFLVAFAFLFATFLALRDAKRSGIDPEGIFDCLIAILLGGLVGGRLLFVLLNWGAFAYNPLRIFMLQEGGMAFQGALILALISWIVVVKIKKMPIWETGDLLVPYIALGQAIGRVGCFLNGCCYGKVIEEGLGVTFPGESVTRIPTQLYSSVFLFFIFIGLLALRKKRSFLGQIFSSYIISYAVFRFMIDCFRGDDLVLLAGIKLTQILSVVFFLGGIVLYLVLRKASKLDVRS